MMIECYALNELFFDENKGDLFCLEELFLIVVNRWNC